MTQLTQAAIDVLAERERQISAEGWTVEHDDDHSDRSLASAAACYADFASYPDKFRECGILSNTVHGMWPESWDTQWWNPSTRRRDLVKAGALILAEIERLDRAEAMPGLICSTSGAR